VINTEVFQSSVQGGQEKYSRKRKPNEGKKVWRDGGENLGLGKQKPVRRIRGFRLVRGQKGKFEGGVEKKLCLTPS